MQIFERILPGNRTVGGRVMSGLLANLLGKFWVIALQLITVPILAGGWGANGFGEWLMLTTVPNYVALSSFGFGTAAAIDMTQKVALGDRGAALGVFQSVWVLVTAVLALMVCIAVAICGPGLALLNQLGIPVSRGTATTVVILVVYSALAVQMSLVSAGFLSTRRYAQGTFFMDLLIPLEAAAVALACIAGYRFVTAAAAMTAVRLVGVIAYYVLLRRFEPWLALGWRHATFAEIRRLTHPALASLSMTFSAALSLQGLIVAIGFVQKPAAAATFATARLFTRTPLQFIGLVGRATLPEMSAAFSQGDRVTARSRG